MYIFKTYDKVDWEKLWSCLERMGINDKYLHFLQVLYEGMSCRVKVGDKQSEKFQVRLVCGRVAFSHLCCFPCTLMEWWPDWGKKDVMWRVAVTRYQVFFLQMTCPCLHRLSKN